MVSEKNWFFTFKIICDAKKLSNEGYNYVYRKRAIFINTNLFSQFTLEKLLNLKETYWKTVWNIKTIPFLVTRWTF